MRPGYLKDLLTARVQWNGSLLRALSLVINLILEGKVPHQIFPVLFGANLFPLTKKDGGVRPIAVGCTLHRIASKIVSRRSALLSNYLRPVQLSYARINGCEAAVQAARYFIEQRLESE